MFVVDAEGVIRWSLAVSAGLGPRADARLAGLDSLRSMSSLRLRSGGLSRPADKLSRLEDTKVYYQNQPVGVVVTETFETASYAASLEPVMHFVCAAW